MHFALLTAILAACGAAATAAANVTNATVVDGRVTAANGSSWQVPATTSGLQRAIDSVVPAYATTKSEGRRSGGGGEPVVQTAPGQGAKEKMKKKKKDRKKERQKDRGSKMKRRGSTKNEQQ